MAHDDAGTLHPAVAALAAAIVRQGDGVAVKDGAVDAEVAVKDLLALAAKTRRIAGDGGFAVVVVIAGLVAEKLGSQQAAGDRFASAGLKDERLFSSEPLTAPRADSRPTTTAPVKAKRGLKKD